MTLFSEGRHDRGWPKGNVAANSLAVALLRPDPRAAGFNYGAALGSPKGDKEWEAFERVREALGTVAQTFSARQWELEEAARRVRHAVTAEEQREAMAAYRVTFHAVDRALETVKAGPLSFFRWGRVGNVLKSFKPFG